MIPWKGRLGKMSTRQSADVTIIGAGIQGASIARRLSQYHLRVVLIDKNSEVGFGTSKASTANVQVGIGFKGALRQRLMVSGTKMFDKLVEEINVPMMRMGRLWIARNESEVEILHNLKSVGEKNGVEGMELIDGEELRKREPNISNGFIAALHTHRTGVIAIYELIPALVENAQHNGVELLLDTEVKNIYQEKKRMVVEHDKGEINSRFIINAAGIGAAKIARMIDEDTLDPQPNREIVLVTDKRLKGILNHSIVHVGKGNAYLNPRCAGNLTLGMAGMDVNSGDDIDVPGERIQAILQAVKVVMPVISSGDIIRYFAGVVARPPTEGRDYIIEPSKRVNSLINVRVGYAGITCSQAIAELVVQILAKQGLNLIKNPRFDPYRKAIPKVSELSDEEKKKLITKDKRYGHIVCRCEHISEGEIVEAIKRGARTIDGIKNRTRAGMGRCQGGFCTPRILQILSRELHLPVTSIKANNDGSEVVLSRTKELLTEEGGF